MYARNRHTRTHIESHITMSWHAQSCVNHRAFVLCSWSLNAKRFPKGTSPHRTRVSKRNAANSNQPLLAVHATGSAWLPRAPTAVRRSAPGARGRRAQGRVAHLAAAAAALRFRCASMFREIAASTLRFSFGLRIGGPSFTSEGAPPESSSSAKATYIRKTRARKRGTMSRACK